MAITNAQQYKQLVNPPMKGKKRPGYRGDDAARSDRAARSEGRASMGRADPGNAPQGDGPETGAPNQGLISEIRRQNLENAPDVFQRPLRQRVSNFISRANPLATLLGFINPALGLATRGIMGLKNRGLNLFKGQTPDYSNMAQFNRLGLFGEDPLENLNKGRGSGLRQPITPIEMISESDMSIPMIERIPESDMSLKLTPEQRQLIEDEQDLANDEMFRNVMAADGGYMGGGIMDAAGRQGYFVGKLVRKAKRAVKKIVKSPVGKIGLGALVLGATRGFGGKGFLKNKILPALYSGGKLTGLGKLAVGAGISSLPLLFGQEEQQQPTGFTGSVGGQIDPRAYTDSYGVLYGAFRADGSPKEGEKGNMKVAGYLDPMSEKNDMAMEMFGKQLKDLTEDELDILDEEIQRLRSKFMAEGGSTEKEPVAKKTLPLLDMGGQEMDLRAEGGFVPIGRMEKADDVPARLSKNEFVFTADAVRNAGDGDVDKGAEVMYNMMKNLEAGGDVSKESQGLKGARKMFKTSQRLEEVL
jgi:hypothetical protein